MSCSCNRSGANSDSLKVSKLLNSSKELNKVVNTNFISREDFLKRKKFPLLKFAYCADPASFQKAFEKHVDFSDFDEGDLQTLAELWETGKDKEYGFDVEQVFSTIEIKLKKLSDCNIKFV